MSHTKAWFVVHKDCDEGEVIFATTRGKAIYLSEAYMDGDFTSIRATRLPKMDGKPLTDENIYLAGLIVSCNGHCYGPAADWENGDDPFFDEKGRAWCSDCWKELIPQPVQLDLLGVSDG